jgi:hypothetical protein
MLLVAEQVEIRIEQTVDLADRRSVHAIHIAGLLRALRHGQAIRDIGAGAHVELDADAAAEGIEVALEAFHLADEIDLLFPIDAGPVMGGMQRKAGVPSNLVDLVLLDQSEPFVEIEFPRRQLGPIVASWRITNALIQSFGKAAAGCSWISRWSCTKPE